MLPKPGGKEKTNRTLRVQTNKQTKDNDSYTLSKLTCSGYSELPQQLEQERKGLSSPNKRGTNQRPGTVSNLEDSVSSLTGPRGIWREVFPDRNDTEVCIQGPRRGLPGRPKNTGGGCTGHGQGQGAQGSWKMGAPVRCDGEQMKEPWL